MIPFQIGWIERLRNRARAALWGQACIRRISRPVVVHVETSTYCNARCPMCPHSIMPRKMMHMQDSTFARITEQLGNLHVDIVNLSLIGEPLMDPKLPERIHALSSRGYRTRITTNASLLTRSKGEAIIKAGLSELTISLNGVSPGSHDAMMKFSKPMYAQCVENLRVFAELRRGLGGHIKVKVSCLLEEDPDADDAARFRNMWQTEGFDVYIGKPVPWHRGEPKKNGEPCYTRPYIFSEIVVDYSGNVVGCCRDFGSSVIHGNVRKETLGEIFNGKQMSNFREMHLRGFAWQSELCSTCEITDHASIAQAAGALLRLERN